MPPSRPLKASFLAYLILTVLGPVFIALALLAVRNRIKR